MLNLLFLIQTIWRDILFEWYRLDILNECSHKEIKKIDEEIKKKRAT